jgi:hypothetical protein
MKHTLCAYFELQATATSCTMQEGSEPAAQCSSLLQHQTLGRPATLLQTTLAAVTAAAAGLCHSGCPVAGLQAEAASPRPRSVRSGSATQAAALTNQGGLARCAAAGPPGSPVASSPAAAADLPAAALAGAGCLSKLASPGKRHSSSTVHTPREGPVAGSSSCGSMQQASLQGYRHAALLPLPDGITAAFMASRQPDVEVNVMLQLLNERQELQQLL